MIAIRRVLTLIVLVAALLATAPARASTSPPWVERVVALGELWGTVRYLHPLGSERTREWDRAFLDHVRPAMDAKDEAAYRDAIRGMLAALGDPATRVVEPSVAPMSTDKHGGSGTSWRGRTLVIRFGDGLAFRDAVRRGGVVDELGKADDVVVDLRGTMVHDAWPLAEALSAWAPAMVSRSVELPTQRCIVHTGWTPQTFETSGGYFSSLRTLASESIAPAGATRPRRIVFLLAAQSPVPWLAIALQAEGIGGLVGPGDVGPERFVSTSEHELVQGVRALVRTCDLVHHGRGILGIPIDRRVSGGNGLDVAVSLARSRAAVRPPRYEADPVRLRWRPDETYADLDPPPLEHRLLAAVRLHQVVARFFPYLDLMDTDWDATVRELLPAFRDANDGHAYAVAVLRMAARMDDSHVNVRGGHVDDVMGQMPPPIRVHMIDGKPTVVRVIDEASAKKVRVGDVVISVDGVAIAERMAAIAEYVPASTAARHALQSVNSALLGRDETTATLVLERGGKTREVTLQRSRARWPKKIERGPAWRELADRIGYVNLMVLQPDQVDEMFTAMWDTRAIIFDMRGYPNGTAWPITPRIALAGHIGRIGAQYHCPEVSTFGGRRYLDYRVPRTTKGRYRGRIVMLIDEEAISQAEATGLYFDAANHVTFVGQPTAGANGDVTDFTLPGGLRVIFTGQAVNHGDGRRLQRKGIIPHVRATPTIAGLRAGKDEVLDRALTLLRRSEPQKRGGDPHGRKRSSLRHGRSSRGS